MTRWTAWTGLALVVVAALASSSTASAQGRRRLVFEGEISIEGKIQKPEVTIFITRQNLSVDYSLELRESFIPKILESAEKKPF